MKLSNYIKKSFLFLSFFAFFNMTAQEAVIEEVIVTAEKRSESLQDVSKAVTALSSEEIERKNIVDFVHHLNFKVANPIIAKMIEMIQNLITTVDSGQPFFSKW